MAERSYTVRVGLDASDVVSGAQSAKNAVNDLGGSISSELTGQTQNLAAVGKAMLAVGTATIAGLGLAAKAAIDWESAWAGVLKTVDATPAQLAAIEDGLRGMARELPASHREIAGVAEAAGQLGVQQDAILSFTRVMIDLGETTNLSADQAATAIAQIGNVMGTNLKTEVSNFGSALVALGNTSATTERDIIEMAQRIAGAGSTVGLAETDVLGFAAALASVGIEAAAGGTAISRVMTDIAVAVQTGGQKLTQFAEVAGLSANDFAVAFEQDPARAIQAFIEGLGGISAAGGNVFEVLEGLQLQDIRVRDALLRLANSSDLLERSLNTSAQAWDENNALAEEAGKRYDTTAAKIEIAKNNIVDAGISLGQTFLPAIEAVATTVADVAGWFGSLPGPVQSAAAGIASIAGVASLAAGGFLLLFPRVIETWRAFRTLSTYAPGVATWLGRIGRAATAAGAILAVAQAVDALAKSGESGAKGVEATTRALLELGEAKTAEERIRILDSLFKDLDNNLIGSTGVDSFADALDRIVSPGALDRWNDFWGGMGSLWREGSKELENAREAVENIDNALASLVTSGAADQAADAFERIKKEAKEQGVSIEELKTLFPQYFEALEGAKNQSEIAAEGVDEATAALERQATAAGMTTEEFEAAQDAFQGLIEEQAGSLASAVDPLAAWEEATRKAAEGAAEAAGEGKEAWQDFADEATVSLQDFITELENQVTAQENWATNIALLAGRVTEDVLNELIRWGPEGAPLVAEMVDATDEEIARLNELIPQSLQSTQEGMAAELQKWSDVAGPIAEMFGQDVADKIATGIANGSTTVDAELEKLDLKITELSPGEYILEADIDAEDFYIQADNMSQDIRNLNESKLEPDADLNIKRFQGQEGILRESVNEMNTMTPTPKANLNTSKFDTNASKTQRELNRLDGEKPTPDADMSLAEFLSSRNRANALLDELDRRRAVAGANLNYSPLSRNVGKAQGRINSLRGKTVTARAISQGESGVWGIFNAISSLFSRTVYATVVSKRVGALQKADGGWIPGYASGGAIDLRQGGHNPLGTTGRADDVLAMVSKDEFVVRAIYAKRYRRLLGMINSGVQIPGFADGGPVGRIARGPVPPPHVIDPPPPVVIQAGESGLSEADRMLLLEAINRPIELYTVDRTVIAREAETGRQILARRK